MKYNPSSMIMNYNINDLFSSPTKAITILAILATTFLIVIIVRRSSKKKRVRSPPEPAGALPIIGHLRVLGGPDAPHVALAKLADEYGPIFKIRLGIRQVVVVSNPELAKEVLQTHDKDLASRPRLVAFELLTYNYAMFGLTPFSDYWREVRKISTHELLSTHRLGEFKHVKENEVRAALKSTHDKWVVENRGGNGGGVVEEMREWFGNVTMNTILQVVVGKSLSGKYSKKEEDPDRCLQALRDFFRLAGVFTAADALPYLRCLDIGGHEKVMKKTAKELDFFAQGWLDSHRSSDRGARQVDFMDILIGVFDKSGASTFEYDADTIIKAVCLTLILAGADATSVTVTWALCLLLNNPLTLKKLQQELDDQVGRNKILEESDLPKLVYLQAVIKETLRLYPPAPLSVPHQAMSDVVIADYDIPTGTQVFVNLHKIHRDPLVWGDPYEFRPERFLTTHKDTDLKGHHYEFIPFSSGRRVCPGISYALQVVPFTLASLLHGFDAVTLDGGPVDVSETGGLTSLKATPFELILTPRLPNHLYEIDG